MFSAYSHCLFMSFSVSTYFRCCIEKLPIDANFVLSPCFRNTTPTWALRGLSYLVARSSALPSPGQSYVTLRSCSLTRLPPPWTPRARRYASLNSEQLPFAESTNSTSQRSAAAWYSPGTQSKESRHLIIIIINITTIHHPYYYHQQLTVHTNPPVEPF